jgi:PAS domain S-box-containing protein
VLEERKDKASKAAETREREAAWARREARAREPYEAPSWPGPSVVKSPHLLDILVNSVREYAIFFLDPNGIITLWGESARLMKWWTKEETQGSHLRMMYPDGGSEDGTAEAHIMEALERGEYTGEGHRVRSDGSTFWARVNLTALRDSDGAVQGFVKVVRDFTTQHASEARAQEAIRFAADQQRRAEEASRAKSLFVATVSHEIRSPLNAILGYLQLLEHETAGPLNDAHRTQLARIRKISNHLLAVVDDVLDESRLESGRFVVSGARAVIGAAIEAALTVARPLAHEKQLELSEMVPAYGAEIEYYGDEHRVRQILVNLLTNAVKFTAPGGRVTVSAGAAESPSPEAKLVGAGPWIYVRVEDTGQGIPADRLEAVFEPFEQAEAARAHPHGGTGLGLAISRRFARLMGGDITVQSEPGRGSKFFLWLPAAAAKKPEQQGPAR